MDKKMILSELINHYANGNTTKFAEMLGVSPQCIMNWKRRGVLDFEKIYSKCYGLSAHWLLTGEGDMLASAPAPSVSESDEIRMLKERLDALESRLEREGAKTEAPLRKCCG